MTHEPSVFQSTFWLCQQTHHTQKFNKIAMASENNFIRNNSTGVPTTGATILRTTYNDDSTMLEGTNHPTTTTNNNNISTLLNDNDTLINTNNATTENNLLLEQDNEKDKIILTPEQIIMARAQAHIQNVNGQFNNFATNTGIHSQIVPKGKKGYKQPPIDKVHKKKTHTTTNLGNYINNGTMDHNKTNSTTIVNTDSSNKTKNCTEPHLQSNSTPLPLIKKIFNISSIQRTINDTSDSDTKIFNNIDFSILKSKKLFNSNNSTSSIDLINIANDNDSLDGSPFKSPRRSPRIINKANSINRRSPRLVNKTNSIHNTRTMNSNSSTPKNSPRTHLNRAIPINTNNKCKTATTSPLRRSPRIAQKIDTISTINPRRSPRIKERRQRNKNHNKKLSIVVKTTEQPRKHKLHNFSFSIGQKIYMVERALATTIKGTAREFGWTQSNIQYGIKKLS
jgi:hypothetical protein